MRENLSVGQNIWGWTGNIFPQPQTQTRLAEVRLPLKAREFVQFRRALYGSRYSRRGSESVRGGERRER